MRRHEPEGEAAAQVEQQLVVLARRASLFEDASDIRYTSAAPVTTHRKISDFME